MKVVIELLEENMGYAYGMVVAKDIKKKGVLKLQKVPLDFAFLMEVGDGAKCCLHKRCAWEH